MPVSHPRLEIRVLDVHGKPLNAAQVTIHGTGSALMTLEFDGRLLA